MAGPEPSEIYAAAALCFHEKYLDDVVESGITKLIEDFFPEAEKEVKKNVIFPSGSKMTKQDLLTLFKDIDAIEDTVPDDEKGDVLVKLLPSLEGNEGKRVTEILKNMIVGISAAKAIKKWMKSEHGVGNPVADKVYLTGDKWPRTVSYTHLRAHET